MKYTQKDVLKMLRESNAIEDIWDRYSLTNANRAWKYIIEQHELTADVIKHTHSLLMVGFPLEEKYKGDWRDCPVWIGGVKKSLPKIVIQSLIEDLCNDINTSVEYKYDSFNPISDHLMFESIHPFIDGNGRVGRIIMNWQSVKMGKGLIIFEEKDKYEKYYSLFK